MAIDFSAIGIDPWTRWFLNSFLYPVVLAALFLTLMLVALTAWCICKTVRASSRLGRVSLLTATFAAAIPALALLWVFGSTSVNKLDRLGLARELLVPPPPVEGFPAYYPLGDRIDRMTSKPTRKEEVHELFSSAKARYLCRANDFRGPNRAVLTDNTAEKYLFFSDRYDSFRVLVINVYYDPHGFVAESSSFESEGDPMPLRYCIREQ